MALSSSSGDDLFEPALYTKAELEFFLVHLGESPKVATFAGLPPGVNRRAVDDVIGRIYELEEVRKVHDAQWIGLRPVRDCIADYLAWMDLSNQIYQRGGPRHPSLYEWDEDGRGVKGAPGSDAGTVRSSIDANGKRKRLAVRLSNTAHPVDREAMTYVPEFVNPSKMPTDIIMDRDRGVVECPICHYAVNFRPDATRSVSSARSKMSRHLKRADTHQDRHRKLWTAVFSSSKTEPVTELQTAG